jgi:hypothetical protein
MGKVSTGLSMSLDGFIAGPNDGPERPLGEGGNRLFNWYFAARPTTDCRVPRWCSRSRLPAPSSFGKRTARWGRS